MSIPLDQLIAGELPYILIGRDDLPSQSIVLPGSFNPLHKGHEGLLLAAEKTTEREGLFELSVTNVDKPPLDPVEIEQRLRTLRSLHPVILTRAPTFAEKAEFMPGAWFAMGYDTAVRLLSSAYNQEVSAMLKRFQELDTRFVVAGRLVNGVFQGLNHLAIPAGFENLFIPIPESLFREDISSTELRRRMGR